MVTTDALCGTAAAARSAASAAGPRPAGAACAGSRSAPGRCSRRSRSTTGTKFSARSRSVGLVGPVAEEEVGGLAVEVREMAHQVPHVGADAVVPPLAGVDRDLHGRAWVRRSRWTRVPSPALVRDRCKFREYRSMAATRGRKREMPVTDVCDAQRPRPASFSTGRRDGAAARRRSARRRCAHEASQPGRGQRAAMPGAQERGGKRAVVLAVVAQVAAVVLEPGALRASRHAAAEMVDDLGRAA